MKIAVNKRHETKNAGCERPAFFVIYSLISLQLISPLLQGERPVLFNQFDGLGLVLVFVFLVPFLLVDVCFDVGTGFFKAGDLQFLVNLLRHIEGVLFVILETDLHQVAFRNEFLVGFILVVQLGVD